MGNLLGQLGRTFYALYSSKSIAVQVVHFYLDTTWTLLGHYLDTTWTEIYVILYYIVTQ